MTLKEDLTDFIDYRFEKIRRLNNEKKVNEVWLVRDRQTEEFAVKRFIKVGDIPCAELKEMSNPILPKIFYCAQDKSETGKIETVIIEEYIAGETLNRILSDGKFFDEDAVQDFLLQMCEGLKILHAAGIIHRDIKLSNIIRQYDGRIKLIDFDAVRSFKPGKSRDTVIMVTAGYSPPEQYGYGQTDPRSDISALGETAKKLLGKNYRGRLEKILNKCIELNPQNRWQSVDELKAALTEKEVVKKSYGGKILIICAAIILSAGIFYFNSTDEKNIPAETPLQEEKISVREKPVENVTEVKPPPKVEETISFPEIVMPSTPTSPSTTNLPSLTSDIPPTQVTESQITLPPNFKPSFPNQENSTLSSFEPSFSAQMTEEKFVRAKYFWNGKRINDWQDNLNEDAEVSHAVYIPAEVWQNNSTPITGTLEITVENFSSESFAPQVEITFDDDGNLQTKTLNGNTLNVGQNFTFRISMNEFRVESLKDALIGSAELNIKIFGANIIGSTATINFIFVQKNFPNIEE